MELLRCDSISNTTTLKIVKLSRTPAYGIKKILLSVKDNNATIYLKPSQLIMILFSKYFANLIIKNEIRSKHLLSILNELGYNQQFYSKNFDKFIDNFYIINKTKTILGDQDDNLLLLNKLTGIIVYNI